MSKKIKTIGANESDMKCIGSNLSFHGREAYKLLRTNIMFSFADEKKCRVIGFTSAIRGEGKSLTTVNTAYSIAETGKKVLLIDGDFRLPTISKKLEIFNECGISNLLTDTKIKVSDCITSYTYPNSTVQIHVALPGYIPPNPSELLGSAKMESFIQGCSDYYDYILIDLPPVTAVSDALVVSRFIDGIVVVVRHNYCNQKVLEETIRQLKFVNIRIIGFAFNGYHQTQSQYYKKYSKYYKKDYKNYDQNYESAVTKEG